MVSKGMAIASRSYKAAVGIYGETPEDGVYLCLAG